MDKTTIEIPTGLLEAANLTAEDVKKELAVRLYQIHKLNDKQAGEMAGDPKLIESLVWRNQETGQFDLNDFLDWASHDLKTPLNSVIGFTKVVLKGIDGPINETQETDLGTAFAAGQRTLALLSYLVEIARLNSGRLIIDRNECDGIELITEVTNRWKAQNPSKPLHADLNLADPVFKLDKVQTRQIVSHLLNLAALRITDGTVTLFVTDSEDTLSIRIQSNGKKNADKFEMDTAMIHFITRSLVSLHGGRMDEPSETDDGLLVNFSLPR